MTLTKKIRKILRTASRFTIDNRWPNYIAAQCDENAALRGQLDRFQAGGRVGVIISGMDCDCSMYHRESIRNAFSSVAEFRKWLDDEYEYAEGPHNVQLTHPDNIDKSRNASRDLALEAFEDGHPHVVYMP